MKQSFALTVSILFMNLAFSQVDTSQLLDDVHVFAARQAVPLRETPKNVQVITASEIKSLAARSVAEVLMLVSSLDVRSRGPFGIQTDVGIRGGTFDQTLIMVDGIKMIDPQTGHHAMNLAISPHDIERIEIIPGGASRAFGQGAFAGAIHIVTKPASETSRFLTDLSIGEYGLVNTHVSKKIVLKNNFHLHASANGLRHDGYNFNTDAESYSFHLKATKEAKRHSLSFGMSGNIRRFGAQNFYSITYPNQHESTRAFFGTFSYQYRGELWTHTCTFLYREHHDRFELFREGRNFYTKTPDNYFVSSTNDTAAFLNGMYYRGHNFHVNRSVVADWNSALDMGFFGNLNIGYEARSEHVWSNRLGFPLQNPIPMPFENQIKLTGYAGRLNQAIVLDHQLPLYPKWLLNYGIWSNFNSEFGRATMAGAEVMYKPTSALSTWMSYNKAFRVPTFTDLFYNVGGAVGSIYLQPEISHNYEAGIRKMKNKWKSSLSVYIRDAKRLIDWIKYPDSSQIVAANITEAAFCGIEGSVTNLFNPNPLSILWAQLSFSWIEVFRNYSNFTSLYAFDVLRFKLSGSVLHKITSKTSVSYQLQYLNRSGNYLDIQSTPQNFPKTFLLNAKIQHTLKKSEFYLEGTNLLNQLHIDRGNIVLPGRWIRMGTIFNL